MRCCFIVILFVISLFFGHTSFAQQNSIKIALGEYPPYYSRSLKHYGIISHITTEAFGAVGVKVVYGWYPWKRAYHYVKTGRWSASFGGAISAERKKYFYISKPIRKNSIVFFHRKKFKLQWSQLSDLSKIRIGGTLDYAYSNQFIQAEKSGLIRVERVRTDIINFHKLAKGRIDIFPLSLDVGFFLLQKKLKSISSQITYFPKPLQNNFVHLFVSKKHQQGLKLIKRFNSGLDKIKKNGTYQKIILMYHP
ncbi:MAG: polar amino acid transport system substrate-binding protein [bacterium]|jgi:polar amino acid transport system substrate-binding protein